MNKYIINNPQISSVVSSLLIYLKKYYVPGTVVGIRKNKWSLLLSEKQKEEG